MDNTTISCILALEIVIALTLFVYLLYVIRPKKEVETDEPWLMSKFHTDPVIKAAFVLDDRKHSRYCGPDLCPDWTPGEVYEVDLYAEYILGNPGWGIEVNIIGDRKKSLARK